MRPALTEKHIRVVHLEQRGAAMWSDVIDKDGEAMRTLVRKSIAEIREMVEDSFLFQLFGKIALKRFFAELQESRGQRLGESNALAKTVGVEKEVMAVLQRAYSFSHLAGCTAAITRHPQHGMVHVRCLDWDMTRRQIAGATRIFEFHRNGNLIFKAVGIAGMVGVLSGVKPGKFSASINFASSKDELTPWLREEPTFLLRRAFETCNTYEEAVRLLKETEVSAPVYFVVCGVRPDEGCVIEIAHKRYKRQLMGTREIKDNPWLVQTNHYDATGPLAAQNKYPADPGKGPKNPDTADLERSSAKRRVAMEEALATLMQQGDASLEELVGLLGRASTQNKFTVQQMMFIPATGEVRAWAGVPD